MLLAFKDCVLFMHEWSCPMCICLYVPSDNDIFLITKYVSIFFFLSESLIVLGMKKKCDGGASYGIN